MRPPLNTPSRLVAAIYANSRQKNPPGLFVGQNAGDGHDRQNVCEDFGLWALEFGIWDPVA
jgi:hypothetical protein